MTERARLERVLDGVAPALVGLCVLAAAAGSSIQRDLLRVGGSARWAAIALLLLVALARAALAVPSPRFPRATALALVAFCGLGLVSVTWSVHPSGTLERAVAEVAVLAAVGLLAGVAATRPRLATRLLDAVLAAAAVVALAGFVYWLAEPSRAAIAASVQYPSRYIGIEQSANTAPLLLAIAMPLALARGVRAKGRAARVGFALLVLAFAATISASGSRGGLVGGFFGLLVVIALAPLERRARVGLAAAAAAALVVAAWAMTLPKALPAPPAAAPATAAHAPRNAEKAFTLGQEIGSPWWTHRSGGYRRSLFDTSVRLRALRGTIDRALGRPLLGYGFGAEQWAFVSRYYAFNSENPENGYVGMFLQTGFIGLGLFLAVLALCVVPALRRPRATPWLVAALGAAGAGLAMGISQSFFHGPGGIAYVAVWTAMLLTAAGATAPARAA